MNKRDEEERDHWLRSDWTNRPATPREVVASCAHFSDERGLIAGHLRDALDREADTRRATIAECVAALADVRKSIGYTPQGDWGKGFARACQDMKEALEKMT